MGKLSLLLALLAGGWIVSTSAGQEGATDIIYTHYRTFKIPFMPVQGPQRLKQLQLFVSMDQGKTWQTAALAPPEQHHFRFMTDRDGLLWFAVQTQDQDGRLTPPTMTGAQPILKVIVDTQKPIVLLQGLPPRADQVGVAWDIRDENLDLALPDSLQLEYRPAGAAVWQPLSRPTGANQLYWTPATRGPLEVRLRARDRAGNWGEALTSISLDGTAAPYNTIANPPFQGTGFQPVPDRKLVNNKRINLKYEVKEVGPSGVSSVDLWYTQDGRSWNKYPPRLSETPNSPNIIFEVNGEGLYGLTLVAKSGVGLSVRPPQLGDRPQIWVEVDLTKPTVQIQNATVGQGADKGKLFILWTAQDRNLAPEPITISYASEKTGPWTNIVSHQANAGRYVWNMPERVPYQFYLRVEALDLAGNVGSAITSEMVKVDLSQPRVNILNVEPAGR
jgi:hypothetical protein